MARYCPYASGTSAGKGYTELWMGMTAVLAWQGINRRGRRKLPHA